jgi:hypothetical protein
MSSLAYANIKSVGLPFVKMWVDRVRIDAVVWAWVRIVETVRIRPVMWFIMLEYANDRILGVDTPE